MARRWRSAAANALRDHVVAPDPETAMLRCVDGLLTVAEIDGIQPDLDLLASFRGVRTIERCAM